MPSSHLILCRPLLFLPPIPPGIRVFSNESTLHMRWPKYWSFSFSISLSNEHPGLISFKMNWLDLQGTLKSLQHHTSKASILRRSAFFTVQFSNPYMTTGKTIALTSIYYIPNAVKTPPLLLSKHFYHPKIKPCTHTKWLVLNLPCLQPLVTINLLFPVKNLPTVQETLVLSLGRENPLEKGMAPPIF